MGDQDLHNTSDERRGAEADAERANNPGPPPSEHPTDLGGDSARGINPVQHSERGINPVQHSERGINPVQHSERGINPVQHSERGQQTEGGGGKGGGKGGDEQPGEGTGGRAGEYS